MDSNIFKRLIVCLLAVMLCMGLVSCELTTAVQDTLQNQNQEDSDFYRYIAYLNSLTEGKDVYVPMGYTVTAYPVLEQSETFVTFVQEAKVVDVEGHLVESYAFTLMIPEDGMNARFEYSECEYGDSKIETVKIQGELSTPEYQGSITVFSDFVKDGNQGKYYEDMYLEIMTIHMEALLKAASTMLARADLTLSALGFTYTPEEPETN